MFVEGCTVGCKACDGNGTHIPNIDHCPDERPAGFEPLHMPGALHPKDRSVNLNATPGSPEDIWYAPTPVASGSRTHMSHRADLLFRFSKVSLCHVYLVNRKFNPWRAPGKAPVFDSW